MKSYSCKRSRSIWYAVAISPSADVTIFNTENLISSYYKARDSLLNSPLVLPRLANLQILLDLKYVIGHRAHFKLLS